MPPKKAPPPSSNRKVTDFFTPSTTTRSGTSAAPKSKGKTAVATADADAIKAPTSVASSVKLPSNSKRAAPSATSSGASKGASKPSGTRSSSPRAQTASTVKRARSKTPAKAITSDAKTTPPDTLRKKPLSNTTIVSTPDLFAAHPLHTPAPKSNSQQPTTSPPNEVQGDTLPPSPKKRRISTVEEEFYEVPSSQDDEIELTMPPELHRIYAHEANDMDIDTDDLVPIDRTSSGSSITMNDVDMELDPHAPSHLKSSPEPEISARDEKTEKLISRIKAEAKARAEKAAHVELDDEAPRTRGRALKTTIDVDDSSDGDMDDPDDILTSSFIKKPPVKSIPVKKALPKPSGSDLSSPLSSDDELNISPRTPSSARTSTSPNGRGVYRRSVRIIEHATAPHPIRSLPQLLTKDKKKKPSPFMALMKEVKAQQKITGGPGGIEAAQAVVKMLAREQEDDERRSQASSSKVGQPQTPTRRGSVQHSHYDSEDEDDEDEDQGGGERKSVVPSLSRSQSPFIELRRDSVAARILGSEKTKHLQDITKADGALLASKIRVRLFWEKTNRNTRQPSPIISAPSADPFLASLGTVVKNNGLAHGLLSSARWSTYPGSSDPTTKTEYASWLFNTVVQVDDELASETALSNLVRLVGETNPSKQLGLGFMTLIDALAGLGGMVSCLEALDTVKNAKPQGIKTSMPVHPPGDKSQRVHGVSRVIEIIGAMAMTKSFSTQELADLVLLLVLIAADPYSPAELSRQSRSCIQSIINSTSTTIATELSICRNIVCASKGRTPAIQLTMLSSLPTTSGRMTRLASWTAYGMLLPHKVRDVSESHYAHVPSLTPILERICAEGLGEASPFDIQETDTYTPDYETIAQRVDIVGMIVSDVRAFVEAAPVATKAKPKTWGKDKEENGPKLPPLELLVLALSGMHDSIMDTRAAHLDRTRAKDVIQRLTVRIRYQRASAEGIMHQRNARRLEDYMVKASKPRPSL